MPPHPQNKESEFFFFSKVDRNKTFDNKRYRQGWISLERIIDYSAWFPSSLYKFWFGMSLISLIDMDRYGQPTLVITSDAQLRLGDLDGLPWLSGQIYWQFLPLFLIYRHHLSHLKRHYETVLRWDIQPLKNFYFKRNHFIYILKKIRVNILIRFTEFIAYLILCRCYFLSCIQYKIRRRLSKEKLNSPSGAWLQS